MIRLVEGGIGVGFGAVDALVATKVTTKGPGGISWPVYLEGAGVLAGLFGNKIGLNTEHADALAISALTLAGARLARAAATGALMQGPRAWGGDGDASAMFDSGASAPALPGSAAASIRLLPGRTAQQSAFSMSPVLFEAPGVTG